jgi:hypothetical protein
VTAPVIRLLTTGRLGVIVSRAGQRPLIPTARAVEVGPSSLVVVASVTVSPPRWAVVGQSWMNPSAWMNTSAT